MILDLNFTSASSEGSDEPVHLKSMTRAFAIHVHTVLPSVSVLGVFTSRNHARTTENGSADVPRLPQILEAKHVTYNFLLIRL